MPSDGKWERGRLPIPLYVWQFPTEGVVAQEMNSAKINKWLNQAAAAVQILLPKGLTRVATAPAVAPRLNKLQVELVVFCQLADRDVKGESFFRQYYQSNLHCTLVLQRRYLPTYSAPVPARVANLSQFLTTAHYVFKQAEFSL
jgi:hypothetical protein